VGLRTSPRELERKKNLSHGKGTELHGGGTLISYEPEGKEENGNEKRRGRSSKTKQYRKAKGPMQQ